MATSVPTALRKSPAFMPQLDSIRFVAVLLVFCYHLIPFAFNLLTSKFFDPGSAVTFFFVLSSFLLTRILLMGRRKAQEAGIGQLQVAKLFLARRALRILPLYYGYLLLLVLISNDSWSVEQDLNWHLLFLSNFQLYTDQVWGEATAHFWTLAVEEQFYLVWPWVALFVPFRHLPKVFWLMIGSGLLCRGYFYFLTPSLVDEEVSLSILTPMCTDSFGLGALLAYQHATGAWSNKRFQTWLYLSIPVAVGVWALFVFLELRTALWTFDRAFIGLLSIAILHKASTGFEGFGKSILENKVFLYLGKISYGLYMYHLLAHYLYHKGLALLAARAMHMTGQSYAGLFDFLNNSLMAPIMYLLLTIAMASASWHFFELPINNLKRFFQYDPKKLTSAPKGVAVPA